jgi:hypothetical protein
MGLDKRFLGCFRRKKLQRQQTKGQSNGKKATTAVSGMAEHCISHLSRKDVRSKGKRKCFPAFPENAIEFII